MTTLHKMILVNTMVCCKIQFDIINQVHLLLNCFTVLLTFTDTDSRHLGFYFCLQIVILFAAANKEKILTKILTKAEFQYLETE